MKLSELPLCIECDKPPIGQGKGFFYVLRVSLAMVDQRAASGVLGVTQIVSGGGAPTLAALRVAEALAPDAEGFVKVLSDEDPRLGTEIIVCQECFLNKGDLAMWVEKANGRESKKGGAPGKDRSHEVSEVQKEEGQPDGAGETRPQGAQRP